MTEHQIKKPTLFISHATSDGEFANAVKQEIEKVFANGVSVFCTSSPGAISVGVDWLSDIEQKLGVAQAVIAIVTPVSIERPWLWFELSNLPSPLDRLQALSMGKAADLKLLFDALISQFGFGKISSFRASNITSRIPKYKDVNVVEADLNEKIFYSGRYTGYTDNELCEVLDTLLFQPDEEKFKNSLIHKDREDLIHNGKLPHFREVDRKLDLPPGTAKRLMNSVAERYGLQPSVEMDNVVRYKTDRRRTGI